MLSNEKENLKRSNRSKYEIMADILRAIDLEGTSISEIQFRTYITYRHLKKYLIYLVQQELLVYRKEDKRFRITHRGVRVLLTYIKMDELLVRNSSHEMAKTSEHFTLFP
jgi:predicted transcriptional regulator